MRALVCLLVVAGPLVAQVPARYAVLIGVNDYDHTKLAPLRYAEADATELGDVLGQAGYEVVLLTGPAGKDDPTRVPTGANVRKHLNAVLAKFRRGDTILIAFAGHGVQFDKQSDSYFCPKDAKPFAEDADTLVSLAGIYRQLERAYDGTKLLLVDACRNDPNPNRGRGIDADSAPPPPKGVAALFSCSAGQRAYEHEAVAHGVFFHHVLKALRGEAGSNAKGEVTLAHLAAYVHEEVEASALKLIGEQAKQSPNLKADLSGRFPVLLSLKRERPAPDVRALVRELNGLTAADAQTAKVRELIRDRATTRAAVRAAGALVKSEPAPFEFPAADVLGRTALVMKEYAAAEHLFRRAVQLGLSAKDGDRILAGYDGLIESARGARKHDLVASCCQEVLDLKGYDRVEDQKSLVMEILAVARADQGRHEEALKLVDKLIETDKDGFYFLVAKARVLSKAERYDEASAAALEALDRLGKSDQKPEIKRTYTARLRYFLSGLSVDAGKTDAGIEQLQALLKDDPDNMTYLNDLGFLWTNAGRNLDEAERSIRRALELDRANRKKQKDAGELAPEDDRDNPAYLDSLGWLLFQRKKYPEALEHLKAATKHEEGRHPEILDHLAQIHLALGNRPAARAVWQDALALTPESKAQERTQAEIRRKLAAEKP